MSDKSRIRHVTHPYAFETHQSRVDQARITGQDIVERPWWYEDTQTGRLYHDVYACIGWPTEVSDKMVPMPGYLGIVGINRPTADLEHYNPQDARFELLDEFQTSDVPTLLDMCLEMREKWGYGVQKNLLSVWYGDAERFDIELALKNELLTRAGKGMLLMTPPDSFYTPGIFDNYVRAVKSTLKADKRRLGADTGEDIFKKIIKEFTRDNPCVLAVGGLIYTLLCRCIWMDTLGGNAFNVEKEEMIRHA